MTTSYRMSDDDAPLEEGVDQLQQWRDRCAKKFPELKAQLDECNDRVNSRKNTEETCVQVTLCATSRKQALKTLC